MRVLITGGNKGIGFGIVERLLKNNQIKEVTITSRSQQGINKANEKIKKNDSNQSVKGVTLDYLNK